MNMDTKKKIIDFLTHQNVDVENTLGIDALAKLIKGYEFNRVLDIGAGIGAHTMVLRAAGKKVTAMDMAKDYNKENWLPGYKPDLIANYRKKHFWRKFDAIWCSHMLEHCVDTDFILRKLYNDLKPGGVLAITVPPLKHEIVGGHVSLWNPGLLIYRLILAGFDCSKASVKRYKYNISVIVKKEKAVLPNDLVFDDGDIEKLAHFFPVEAYQNFDGNFGEVNWS